MRMILAYENSLSRDFAASHLAGSDPLLDIHPAASLAQSITLANRLDRLDVVALDLGLHDLDGLTGLRRFKRDCREGAQIVSELNQKPIEMLGHVTSSYFSPNLNKSIALAVVKDGKNMMGKKLFIPMENKNIGVKISNTIFYDEENKSINAKL